jgi:RNA polymerase sigma-70 factor (ECF subfamily)
MEEICLAAGNGSAKDGAAAHANRDVPSSVAADGTAQQPADGSAAPPDMACLVAEHADALFRYAFRLTGAAADGEDLTQQTFLIAQRKIDQLRDACNTRAWLMTVMRRAYCRLQIKNRTEREKTVPLDVDNLPADDVSDRWEIDRELLQTAIDELPDEFKFVLLSFYFENRSYREIAAEFELPLGTVMSRLARAKSHLRTRLFEAELAGASSHDGSTAPRRRDP